MKNETTDATTGEIIIERREIVGRVPWYHGDGPVSALTEAMRIASEYVIEHGDTNEPVSVSFTFGGTTFTASAEPVA